MKEKNRWMTSKQIRHRLLIWIVLGVLSLLFAACNSPKVVINVNNTAPRAEALSDDWSMYLANNARSGYDGAKNLTAASASGLKIHWKDQAGGSISAQPLEVNGLIYWGSWDGYEHATNMSGNQVWQTNIGKTTNGACLPPTVGVASTATVVSLPIQGKSTPVVLVGGGDHHFYALNALTGKVLWKTALGTSPNQFIWSSPAVYKGSVYIGLASFGDCPLVQGQFFQLDTTTGKIEHTFDVVPPGCLGGTVWSSPAINEAKGTIYVGTSEPDTCKQKERYAAALLELSASDLNLVDYWQLPLPLQTSNGDFGSTPTLFQVTVGGTKQDMVGILNKNGSYYAFQQDALSKGPVWTATVAAPAVCPQCGDGNVAPAAWDGSMLYIAAGNIPVNEQKCLASLRAVDPTTGVSLWQVCLQDGPVLGAVTVIPGMVIIGEGAHLLVFASDTGHQLFNFTDTTPHAVFYAPASISLGVIYIGDSAGTLYAFSI